MSAEFLGSQQRGKSGPNGPHVSHDIDGCLPNLSAEPDSALLQFEIISAVASACSCRPVATSSSKPSRKLQADSCARDSCLQKGRCH